MSCPRLHSLQRKKSQKGFSLLEVILALTILGFSMTVILSMMQFGLWRAADARDRTIMQILCQSKLAETLLLPELITPTDLIEFLPEETPDQRAWRYSIDVIPLEQQIGLVALTVTVARPITEPRPLEFTITRWIQDPGTIEFIEEPEETETSTTPSEPSTPTEPTGV